MLSSKLTGLKQFFDYIDSDAVVNFVDIFDSRDLWLITLVESRIELTKKKKKKKL